MKKYNYIDFGRGIAILLVIMIHVGQIFENKFDFKIYTDRGRFGVQLFFILSAITLFSSYGNRLQKDDLNAKKFFFIRRFFRIAPLYYVSAIYGILVGIMTAGIHTVQLWKVILSVLFLNSIVLPVINYIPPGGWSIGVEMIFYCFVPYLFYKINSVKKSIYLITVSIVFSLICKIIVSIFLDFESIMRYKFNYEKLNSLNFEYWFPIQFPVFCFGILLFNLFKNENSGKRYKHIFILLSICSFIFGCLIESNNLYFFTFTICLFIIGLKNYKFENKWSYIFLLIGKYSFSMYLCHFTIIRVYTYFFDLIILKKSNLTFLISYFIIVIITLLLSSILFVFEKRGIYYGNLLIERMKLKKST